MQIKYIVATIASLAVSSAVASPVADPAANDNTNPILARAESGDLATQANKELHQQYGKKLLDAYQKNWATQPELKKPTYEEFMALKEKSQQSAATNLDGMDKEKRWSYDYQWRRQWHYKNGCQLYYPFAAYGHWFDWDLKKYYTCFGVYQDCWGYDGCDCDYGYC